MSLNAIRNVIVIGAGPAGLTAAYELAREGVPVRVTEAAGQVGGISRTEVHNGYRFDIGGHRFFTQDPFIQELWEEVLGDELIRVPRLSRIYYGGHFYPYPLEIFATLRNLGILESLMILASFFKARLRPHPVEETFDQWVVNRFGERLYQRFFRTYTEKVWGIPCHEIRAEWAAQRIKGLSLASAVWGALMGAANHKTLIREFHYPRLGPGQLWERVAERIVEQGGELHLCTEAVRIGHRGGHVTAVTLRRTDGSEEELAPERVVSSMPITQLIARLDPPPPPAVRSAAAGLKYRAFLIVNLVVRRTGIFPDQWLYIHDPGLRVGRIQNFGNWSPELVADPATSCLGMEYFCDEGDALWRMEDADLRTFAEGEAARLGFLRRDEVEEAVVIRQPKAYPVYDGDYRRRLTVIRDYLAGFDNLQTIGRNGMHRYNNQDHSMLTAILAVRNLSGEHHDLWRVNEDAVYQEGAAEGASALVRQP